MALTEFNPLDKQYISIDEIVRQTMIIEGKSTEHDYMRYFELAIRGLKELTYDILQEVRSARIPIDCETRSITLPFDYIDYLRVGLCNNGRIDWLVDNRDMTISNYKRFNDEDNGIINHQNTGVNDAEDDVAYATTSHPLGRRYGQGGGQNRNGYFRVNKQSGTMYFSTDVGCYKDPINTDCECVYFDDNGEIQLHTAGSAFYGSIPINGYNTVGHTINNVNVGAAVAGLLQCGDHSHMLVSNMDDMLAINPTHPILGTPLAVECITKVFQLPSGNAVPGFTGAVGDYNESWWADAQAAECVTITITDIASGDFLHAAADLQDPQDLMAVSGPGAVNAAGYGFVYEMQIGPIIPFTTPLIDQHVADYGLIPHFGNLNQVASTGNAQGYDIEINWGPETCSGGDPGGGTEIYIEYVSNANYSHYHDATDASYGVDATEKPFIPMVHILAAEALRSYIAFKAVSMLDSTNRKTSIQDVSRARTNYYNQKRLARARLMKFNQEEAITAGRKAFKQSPKI